MASFPAASLRTRLIAGLVALVTVGLLVANVATYSALQSFLLARVDEQLTAAVEPVALELQSSIGPRRGARPSGRALIPAGTYAVLVNDSGAVLAELPLRNDGPAPRLPGAIGAQEGESWHTVTAREGEERLRLLSTPVLLVGGADGALVLSVPLTDVEQTLRRLLAIEITVSLLVLALLTAAGLWVVRLGLRPLRRMEEAAGAIAAGDLGRRIEDADERTEVGRLGLALNAMLGHLEAAFSERTESERRLRRFIADASHELRTPLTSIRGYAELFRRGAADRPEDLANAMRRIEDEAKRMGVLVDDLLLLARLDQGRPLERRAVDLVRVAEDAVADAGATDPERRFLFEPQPPVLVEGDEARLRQVAANLVSNAMLHTPADTTVLVRVAQQGGTAVLEVADDGPGLQPEHAARIFERFYRGDGSRTRASGGTGLGLSIVAAIAEAHGGRATVTSSPGAGATFTVSLPAQTQQAEPQPRPQPPAPQPAGVASGRKDL
ncbi:MAG: Two-component system sensor histidine kinase [uncultured Acidimicrobiales bacterium]|uniref:histidine kinase n=1 Tax=uncultured Acidimicrobiales bacterium TaxID=310071 RepID=A0A6J4I0L6_9ACTN|nr:MAG: Two-component system sensor histidine kinase [uncultured Acidimicrobiales bacterium]